MHTNKGISEVSRVQYVSNSIPTEIGKNIFSSIMKEIVFISDEMYSIVIMDKKVKMSRINITFRDIQKKIKIDKILVKK